MTQVHVKGEKKSHYKIRFLVQKIMGGIVAKVEYEFIGTDEKKDEYIEVKYQDLAAEYFSVLLDDVVVLPSDNQLLFCDNKF